MAAKKKGSFHEVNKERGNVDREIICKMATGQADMYFNRSEEIQKLVDSGELSKETFDKISQIIYNRMYSSTLIHFGKDEIEKSALTLFSEDCYHNPSKKYENVEFVGQEFILPKYKEILDEI